MGHPCCAVHDCKLPLRSHGDRFCRTHRLLEAQCAIEECGREREAGFRTCEDPGHRALETNYFAKGTAMFQLRARLRKAGVTVPTDDSLGSSPDFPADETDECEGKSTDGSKRVKAVFGPRRTHTQFLVMRPCGVILSRATMFGSEAISGVNVRMVLTLTAMDHTYLEFHSASFMQHFHRHSQHPSFCSSITIASWSLTNGPNMTLIGNILPGLSMCSITKPSTARQTCSVNVTATLPHSLNSL